MEWKPVWYMAKMIFHKLTAISGIRNKHKKRRKDGNLMKKTDQDNRDKNQAERLRKTLKSFGINTSEELDHFSQRSGMPMPGLMSEDLPHFSWRHRCHFPESSQKYTVDQPQ